jgi:2-oxoisovalerate dehydrogenase E1 component
VVILTYGNGVRLSLRAVAAQPAAGAKRVRVVDLRWIHPLPVATIVEEAKAAGTVLIVDEGRRTGGVCEPLAALLAEQAPEVRITIEAGADTFIPLGDAWRPCLPSVESITAKLAAL